MRDDFVGFYRPTEEQFSELWKNCTFVLDASVLLNLYRYPRKAREAFLMILRGVSDRLWIPHQVGLEYQENRLAVIAERVERYDEAQKVLQDMRGKLEGSLGNLQLEKRHSLIDPKGFLEKMGIVFDAFVQELDLLRKQQPDVCDEDEIRNQIDSLFDGRVGPAPKSQEWLDEIYRGGAKRYKEKRPPGYMDLEKADSVKQRPYVCGDLVFRREYGDLLLWHQIIEEAKPEDGFKEIILLIDDEKEDWWWIVESRGKKTIGPRPELVDEIRSRAGVSSFYMYNSERFMRFADKYLGIKIEQESIKQVGDITQLKRREEQRGRWESAKEMHRAAEKAFTVWLRSSYPHDVIVRNRHGFPDFTRQGQEDQLLHGYELKTIRMPYHLHRLAPEALHRGYREVKAGKLDSFRLIVVVDEEVGMPPTRESLGRLEIPSHVEIDVFRLAVDAEDRPVVQLLYSMR